MVQASDSTSAGNTREVRDLDSGTHTGNRLGKGGSGASVLPCDTFQISVWEGPRGPMQGPQAGEEAPWPQQCLGIGQVRFGDIFLLTMR